MQNEDSGFRDLVFILHSAFCISTTAMELSVNYSLELADLLKRDAVRVDRIKCADWPDMIADARKLRPVYVHFPLDAGSPTGRPANYAVADQMARETDTPYVNLHLVTWQRDFPE